MKYTDKQIRELKSDPSLWQMVLARVPSLEQIGKEWRGLCPVHEEDSPSFTLRTEDGVWLFHCFGCGKTGNAIQLVEQVDRISFSEAVEKVASFVGWKEGKKNVEQTFSPLKEDKEAITFPISRITEAESALGVSKIGCEWLGSRGITLDVAKVFHLGFVQSAKAINPHHPWVNDGWIIFPTIEGDTITSLKYRSVKGKKTETGEPGFLRKSGMATGLFNLQAVDAFSDVFLVEGEPDALVMAQAGYTAVSLPSAGYNLQPAEKDRLMASQRVFLAGDMDNPGQQAMTKLWTELREHTYRLEWPIGMKDANQTFLEVCGGDVSKFTSLCEQLKQKAIEQPIPFMHDLRETMRIGSYVRPEDDSSRLVFPWPTVDSWVSVLPGDVMAVSATETGTGKALAHGTPVVHSERGFISIEDVEVGDKLIGINGLPTEVLGVFPQGERPAYKVSFSCGTEVICDGDHLWEVGRFERQYATGKYTHEVFVNEVVTTTELAKRRLPKSNPYRVPFIKPVEFESVPKPIHPYLLGVLIGDGGLTHTCVRFSSADEEIKCRVRSLLPESIEMKYCGQHDYSLGEKINGGSKSTNPIRNGLRQLGLLGYKSEHKFIPDMYLYQASAEERFELLRGLLDTDGTVGKNNNGISFSTSSPKLARDFRILVFSLGGFAYIREKKTDRLLNYNISVNFSTDHRLFWLPRKHERARKRAGWRRVRAIRSIQECGTAPMTCLKVAAPDGLFLTKDFIPTHNTSWVMDILLENAIKHGKIIANYSAEVMPKQYAVRAAAYLLAKDKKQITEEDLIAAAELMGEARFYNGYKPGANWKEAVELLEWAIRILGADIAVVDHLHFLTRSEKDETKAQAEAMRMLKDLAVKYNRIIIVLGQPRKPLANHRGREMVTQDLKGSETFGSDASQVFILHRDRKSNGDDENMPIFDPICKIKLDKSRESEPRATKLFFDGARCTFGMLEKNYNEYDAE